MDDNTLVDVIIEGLDIQCKVATTALRHLLREGDLGEFDQRLDGLTHLVGARSAIVAVGPYLEQRARVLSIAMQEEIRFVLQGEVQRHVNAAIRVFEGIELPDELEAVKQATERVARAVWAVQRWDEIMEEDNPF